MRAHRPRVEHRSRMQNPFKEALLLAGGGSIKFRRFNEQLISKPGSRECRSLCTVIYWRGRDVFRRYNDVCAYVCVYVVAREIFLA